MEYIFSGVIKSNATFSGGSFGTGPVVVTTRDRGQITGVAFEILSAGSTTGSIYSAGLFDLHLVRGYSGARSVAPVVKVQCPEAANQWVTSGKTGYRMLSAPAAWDYSTSQQDPGMWSGTSLKNSAAVNLFIKRPGGSGLAKFRVRVLTRRPA